MPRSNQKGHEKATNNKYRNLNQRVSLEKKPDQKPYIDKIMNDISSTERFSESKDGYLKGDKTPRTIRISKKKPFTHKTKQTYLPMRGSMVSMHSTRSHERVSRLSNVFDLEKRLYLLKTDTNEVKRSRKKPEFLASEDDLDQEEEWQRSEIEADYEFETDSESSTDKDYMDKLCHSFRKSAMCLEQRPSNLDFFDILGEIPNIEDISLDLTIWEMEAPLVSQVTSKIEQGDTGKFVDPLTGVEIKSSSSILTPDAQAQPEVSEHSIELEESSVDLLGQIRFEEDEDFIQVDEADENMVKSRDDIIFGKWLHSLPSKASATDEFSQGIYDIQKHKVRLYVLDFVNYLMDKVVRAAELGDPNRIFGRILDKKKLMEDLDDKLKRLETQRNANLLLNKGVVEYFRRKGDYRGLKADQPDQVKPLLDKNTELQERLYELLCREEELQNLSALKISNLTAEAEAAEIVANQSVDNLEKIIKKTFCRDRFQNLNEVVKRSLNHMSHTRNTISNRHLVLLQGLHTLGKLKEEEDKFDDLGSGLKIQNFENLQATTSTLANKVHEREHELNSLHIRHNKDLHMMTHLMECHTMIQNAMTVKESVLQELLEEKQRAREELNYQKLVRKGVRNDIIILRQQNGLSGNEALLLDYDKTTDELKEARARVSKMRHKHKQLESYISRLEDKYNRGTII